MSNRDRPQRRNRWGPPVPPIAAGRIPNVVEPYVSDAEAVAALMGESASVVPHTKKRPRDYDSNTSYYGRGVEPMRRQDLRDNSSRPYRDNSSRPYPNAADPPQAIKAPGEETAPVEKKKPDFGLSGALATDTKTGNLYKGVLLKFSEPPEARTPASEWRLYVFDKTLPPDSEPKHTLTVHSQSAYLFGRDINIADIPLVDETGQPSNTCSKQHCVLQYRAVPVNKNSDPTDLVVKPYLMDLQSTNGTFLNGKRIDDSRYYELRKGDVLTMGRSNMEYVLLK